MFLLLLLLLLSSPVDVFVVAIHCVILLVCSQFENFLMGLIVCVAVVKIKKAMVYVTTLPICLRGCSKNKEGYNLPIFYNPNSY